MPAFSRSSTPGALVTNTAPSASVGVARGPDKDAKYISVQLFGRPQSLAYKFQISNASKETVTYTFGGETNEVKPSFGVTHTACQPDAITFVKVGSGGGTKTLNARYEAKDGQVYLVNPAPGGGIRVEVKARETVR